MSVSAPSPELVILIEDSSLPLPESGLVHTFYRILIGSQMFYSAKYSRVKKRNSFTISFCKNSQTFFGKIQLFVIIDNLAYALTTCLVPDTTSCCHFNLPADLECLNSKCLPVLDGPLCLIPVNCIAEKCIYVEVESTKYISRFPTTLALD